MISIPVRTRVAPDGTITVKAPLAYCDQEIEAYLVVQPVEPEKDADMLTRIWRQSLQSLAGSITDQTFERGMQGDLQEREAL